VEFRQATVVDAARIRGTFSAELDDGCTVHARKLLIATGVVDVLPSVPGLRSLYGSVVFHCAYCDGWEIRDRPLAVYGRGESAVSEVRALTRFSRDIILCTDDDEALPATVMSSLERAGAMVCSARVRLLEPCTAGLVVVFADGSVLQRGALFFCGPIRMQSPLAQRLGCTLAPNGLVDTRENEAAGVPGLYVAGDASRSVLLSVVAAGEGATAAFAINRELLHEDLGA
jgi:thioredoxin reductase